MGPDEAAELLGGRQEGESRRAWGALLDYALMPLPRSLARLAGGAIKSEQKESGGYRLGALRKWSAAHDWQGRVGRLDEALDRERAAVWLQRRADLRERDWLEGETLRRKGLKLLGDVSEARADQAGRLVMDGSKLQRLAAELETERMAGAGMTREELLNAVEQELARVAGLGPAGVSGAAEGD